MAVSNPVQDLQGDVPLNNSWSNTSTVTFNCTFNMSTDSPYLVPRNLSLYINASWTNSVFFFNKSN
ncbi:MAG: hypothetical protein AABY09_05610, partial [Nanoarchaeota archaeon]